MYSFIYLSFYLFSLDFSLATLILSEMLLSSVSDNHDEGLQKDDDERVARERESLREREYEYKSKYWGVSGG